MGYSPIDSIHFFGFGLFFSGAFGTGVPVSLFIVSTTVVLGCLAAYFFVTNLPVFALLATFVVLVFLAIIPFLHHFFFGGFRTGTLGTGVPVSGDRDGAFSLNGRGVGFDGLLGFDG